TCPNWKPSSRWPGSGNMLAQRKRLPAVYQLMLALFLLLTACTSTIATPSSETLPAAPNVTPTPPTLGTVTELREECEQPGELANSTCLSVEVTCPAVPPIRARLRVKSPP